MPLMDETAPGHDPLARFGEWLDDAMRAGIRLPHAMAVATASPDGDPSVRMLLLRGVDERGFVFFTNYESLKGRQLAANPRAAVAFHWDAVERQVRVSGGVQRVSHAESEAYFASRPRASRIAAWASRQGETLPADDVLDQAVRQTEDRYPDDDVPLPPYWGGYRLRPEMMEFWEARPDRLHERLLYTRRPDGGWEMRRLAP